MWKPCLDSGRHMPAVSGPPPLHLPPLLSGPSTVRQLSSLCPEHCLQRWFLSVSGLHCYYEDHFGNIYFKLVIIAGICSFLTLEMCVCYLMGKHNNLHPDLDEGYIQNPHSPIPVVVHLTYQAHMLPHMSLLLCQAPPRTPAALQVGLRPQQATGLPESRDAQSHHSEGQRSPKLPGQWLLRLRYIFP